MVSIPIFLSGFSGNKFILTYIVFRPHFGWLQTVTPRYLLVSSVVEIPDKLTFFLRRYYFVALGELRPQI